MLPHPIVKLKSAQSSYSSQLDGLAQHMFSQSPVRSSCDGQHGKSTGLKTKGQGLESKSQQRGE